MGDNKSYIFVGIAYEPGDPELGGMYRRGTGDNAWEKLSNGLPATSATRAIAIDPDRPKVVYAGTEKGVYVSPDHGSKWEPLGSPRTPVWSLLFHPRNSDVMFAGCEAGEIYRSQDRGETWRLTQTNVDFPIVTLQPRFSPKRIMGMAADPNRPDEMYAAVEIGGLIRSLDGGESWHGVTDGIYLNEDSLDFHGVAVTPALPRTVYVINRIGMFKSSDRGEHWQPLNTERLTPPESPRGGAYCRCLKVAPDDPRTFYMGAGPAFRSDIGALYRSRDLGASWEKINLGTTPKSTMFGVAIDKRNPSHIVCASRSGQVFSSLDRAITWEDISLPDADVVAQEDATTGRKVFIQEVSSLAVG